MMMSQLITHNFNQMPRTDHTKHLSFLFPVDTKFFSEAVRIVTQYEINVHYTLDWRGVVLVQGYTIKPGMACHIIKWEELEDQIQLAAENNSKQYRRPGEWMSRQIPQPFEKSFYE